jgi:hypothetical protein
MHLVEWRAPWRGLLVCALLGGMARIDACAPEYPQSAPRLAWVGDGYLAVWADRDGDLDGEERALWPDVVAERDGWAVSFVARTP